MLQDSRIPANGFDRFAFRMFIQVFHGDRSRPRHNRRISSHTQAPPQKNSRLLLSAKTIRGLMRINSDVKWNRLPLPLGQLRRSELLVVFLTVLE
jgi:hypothetical protein